MATSPFDAPGAHHKRGWLKWLLVGGGVGSIPILITIFAVTISLGTAVIAAGLAWDRISNLFDDHDWKNAVQRVASYHLDPDRENLILYRTLYVDGKKVADDNNAHWLNFGLLSTFYRPQTGPHTYTFDLGREATIQEVILLMACKECDLTVGVAEENPPDPDHPGQIMNPDQVGAYFTPTNHFPDLSHTGRKAAANDIAGGRIVGRYVTLFVNSKSEDSYFLQILAYPPGKKSNTLEAGQPGLDSRYSAIYNASLGSAIHLPGGANPVNKAKALPLGGKLSYLGGLTGQDENRYVALYPVVGTPNAHTGAGSLTDSAVGYRKIYLQWQLHPDTVGKLDSVGLQWKLNWLGAGADGSLSGSGGDSGGGNPTPTPTPGGFGAVPTPTPDGTVTAAATPTTTGYGGPTVTVAASSKRTQSQPGAGGSLTAFQLISATPTPGSGNGNGNGNGGKGNNPGAGQPQLPSPPAATHWRLYLLDSNDPADKTVLDSLFGGSLTGSTDPDLPANRLLKEFTSPDQTSTGPLSLPTGDKRDTLVFEFDESNFPTLAQLVAGGSGNGGALTDQPLATPHGLTGIPADYLSPAAIYAYQRPPVAPVNQPRPAPGSGYGGTHRPGGPSAGQYDIRWFGQDGQITPQKIEEIIAQKPWTGIAPGGGHAGEAPQPNKLTGKGQVFYDLGKKYGINPAYAVAFSLKETELGTTGYHVYNSSTGQWGYNLYGMSLHGSSGIWSTVSYCQSLYSPRFCAYNNWDESIEEFYVLLSSYAEGKTLTHDGDTSIGQYACPCTTIDRILAWYAPRTENDTDLYIQQVEGWVSSWGALAPPTGEGGSGSGGGGNGDGQFNPDSPVPPINQYDCSEYDDANPCGTWADSTCGPTSATMMISWISGQRLHIRDTLKYAAYNGVIPSGTQGWAYLDQMAPLYHFKWRRQVYNSVSDYLAGLKDLTAQGQPVIANIQGNPYWAGHFFVVVAYNPEDNTFTINDPADVRQPGNPPGVVQKWSEQQLGQYLAPRTGASYPAIIISAEGSAGGGAANPR